MEYATFFSYLGRLFLQKSKNEPKATRFSYWLVLYFFLILKKLRKSGTNSLGERTTTIFIEKFPFL